MPFPLKTLAAACAAACLGACGGSDGGGDSGGGQASDGGGDERRTAPPRGEGSLKVVVAGVEPNMGGVFVALQTRDGFAGPDGLYARTVPADTPTVDALFDGIAPGEYVIVAFQDTDGDGAVTIGSTGPTEPWALSGPPQRGAPAFEPAMITIRDEQRGQRTETVTLSGGT